MGVAACGDDDEPSTPSAAAGTEQPAGDLQPIKEFLLAHTESLGGHSRAVVRLRKATRFVAKQR